MIQEVTLPKLGETVQTSTVERWRKKEGDPVTTGDVLCEITTDKATLEVESYYRGTLLKILAPTGVELPVGTLIAVVGDPGEAIPPEVLAKAGAPVAAAAGSGPAPVPASAAAAAGSGAAPPCTAAPASPAIASAAVAPAASVPASALGDGRFHVVELPKLGETVEVSTIEKWRKKEGDEVHVGDVLCEITTDKATLEVESYQRGTLLKILVQPGRELPVGTPIAIVGQPGTLIPEDLVSGLAPAAGGATPAAPPAAAALVAVAATAAAPAALVTCRGRAVASPRARRLARQENVALDRVRGTGPGGRIVEADVRTALAAPGVRATPLARKTAQRQGVDLSAVAGGGPRGKVLVEDVLRAAQAAPAAPAPAAPAEVLPLTAMRRVIADRMAESKRTIPCYYLEMDADVTDLVCLRNKLNAKGAAVKITFNDFMLRACGLVLRAFPVVNSRWVEGCGIQRRGAAGVGFAVALDEGLIVPVVRDADRKSLRDISVEAASLVERARAKRLRPEEYQGGSLTVSNLGMFGVRSFIPIVNPGEAAILGLGLIEERVVFRQGGIQVRKMMTLTLSTDHRLVDGAVGAQFLEAIRDLLEAPQRLAE